MNKKARKYTSSDFRFDATEYVEQKYDKNLVDKLLEDDCKHFSCVLFLIIVAEQAMWDFFIAQKEK